MQKRAGALKSTTQGHTPPAASSSHWMGLLSTPCYSLRISMIMKEHRGAVSVSTAFLRWVDVWWTVVCVCVCVCPLVFLSSIPRHPSSLPHHTRHPLRSSWKEAVEQHSPFMTKQHCVPALSSTPTVILNPPIECFKSICDSPRAQITEKEA